MDIPMRAASATRSDWLAQLADLDVGPDRLTAAERSTWQRLTAAAR